MNAHLGKIACRLGRHDREYFINTERLIVIVWCKRCRNPKIASAFDAKRIGVLGPTAPPADQRQLPERARN